LQLGKLGLGGTGFFKAQKSVIRFHSQNFFAIREVEKKNGA